MSAKRKLTQKTDFITDKLYKFIKLRLSIGPLTFRQPLLQLNSTSKISVWNPLAQTSNPARAMGGGGSINTLSTRTRENCIKITKNVTTRCDFHVQNAQKCICGFAPDLIECCPRSPTWITEQWPAVAIKRTSLWTSLATELVTLETQNYVSK